MPSSLPSPAGNSLTLPLALLVALLSAPGAVAAGSPAAAEALAAPWIALFLSGWSPSFWGPGQRFARHELQRELLGLDVAPDDKGAAPDGLHPPAWPAARRRRAEAWRRICAVGDIVRTLMSPPLWGVVAGCVLGFALGSGSGLVAGLARFVLDAAGVFSPGTLPVTAVVLAASLSAAPPTPPKTSAARRGRQTIRRLALSALRPDDPTERRVVLAGLVARGVLVPLAGIWLVTASPLASLLPAPVGPADVGPRVLRLALLLTAAMPPAQNLLVLLNLPLTDEGSSGGVGDADVERARQRMAALAARVVLRLYCLSAVPLALVWCPLFVRVAGLGG